MKKVLQILTGILLFFPWILHAQNTAPVAFGKITPQDFDLSKSRYDTTAEAVVIADMGYVNFEYEPYSKRDFVLVFTHFKRIKILRRSGVSLAKQEINLYHYDNSNEERLTFLNAITYNLEGGKVVESVLDPNSIYTDHLNKEFYQKKLAMPGVKEGSILDITYTIKSDYYSHLRPWNFQDIYPVLWSEYEVHAPHFFNFKVIQQGDTNFYIDTSYTELVNYSTKIPNVTSVGDRYLLDGNDPVHRWVKKDVPPVKEETYLTTLFNYIPRVEFQLNSFQWTPSSLRHDFMTSWTAASLKLLQSPRFGGALDDANRWMRADLKRLQAETVNTGQRIRKIFEFVRDNFHCTSHDDLYAYQPLKAVFKERKGNEAELNLLLTAMLRHEQIEADPVVLSTRENGVISESYPIMDRLNYVICVARDSNQTYFLDASRPNLGFNQLPGNCYNGVVRAISLLRPQSFLLSADSLKEQKYTLVLISADEKNHLTGSYSTTLGNQESYLLRHSVPQDSTLEMAKTLQVNLGTIGKIQNLSIDSLRQPDLPVKISFDIEFPAFGPEEIVYFNPMLLDQTKENPFEAEERRYPVEMPYCTDAWYSINMEIPLGYQVEELPASTRIKLNENDGYFEYLITQNQGMIQMKTRLKLNRANWNPEDYLTLRQFYGQVVKKQSEVIVFRKKQGT